MHSTKVYEIVYLSHCFSIDFKMEIQYNLSIRVLAIREEPFIMGKEMKLAVLIDAENISSQYVDIIMSEANALGDVIYRRIYGNWTNTQMASWKTIILDNALQPIQQYNNTIGKNSSDSALIIDAMDLLYQNNLDGFCIVSSDSDFTRLASRLRESQKYVMGMGESKTPRSFISACNKFLYLDVLLAESNSDTVAEAVPLKKKPVKHTPETWTPIKSAPPAPENADTTSGKDIETIKQTLIKITEENSDDTGWIFSGTLGNLLNKQFSDFDVRNFGFKKLVPFVESLGLFEVNTITDDRNETVKHNYFKLKKTPKRRTTRRRRS